MRGMTLQALLSQSPRACAVTRKGDLSTSGARDAMRLAASSKSLRVVGSRKSGHGAYFPMSSHSMTMIMHMTQQPQAATSQPQAAGSQPQAARNVTIGCRTHGVKAIGNDAEANDDEANDGERGQPATGGRQPAKDFPLQRPRERDLSGASDMMVIVVSYKSHLCCSKKTNNIHTHGSRYRD